ncbi:50S ribosomal protein L17 [Candidatus Saccharibacteria bacterium RIFCSPHIGHO2_01_FULL_48_12]|nr:MAG: 50S ribosomal protein L17 [Candidatus Saccharibacteria bacterium RIFCSPHIGHO2_01_FULL_48_12]
MTTLSSKPKFGRLSGSRKSLIANLSRSLILNERIKTTLPKAKETVRYTEKLVTKAKDGSLHKRRQIIKALSSVEAANKLVDEIGPKLNHRTSGHFKITKNQQQRGDGALMVTLGFVDDLKKKESVPKPAKPIKKAAKSTHLAPKVTKKTARKKS